MSNLEVLKFKYQIAKDKLLLFATSTGGSFITLINVPSLNLNAKIILYITLGISFLGVLINLHRISKISREIEKDKNDKLSNNNNGNNDTNLCP